jgi:hypothetical protein
MKILQYQCPALKEVCTVHCACGCQFEFEKTDPCIEMQLDKWDNAHYYIRCPECGNRFHLRNSFFLK